MNERTAAERAQYVRDQLPPNGLFAGMTWRIAPHPFPLPPALVAELERLGPQLLAFYRACNTLYRHSVAGKQPRWVADYLDAGKPSELIALSQSDQFKSALPRVIRPDVILSDDGFFVSELDSVPGGIGLTGWLGKTYGELGDEIVGGAHGMMEGFATILGDRGVVVASEEAATYRPEMEWLGAQCGFRVMRPEEMDKRDACPSIYRFFELFDLANVPNAWEIISGNVTPPPKPQLEEKLLFAFLWQPQLEAFWREHLGATTLAYLRKIFPRTWIVDATPLPPHAVIPELGIHDWREMARFSQKQRELVLKLSGFHEHAWGARSVHVGHDLSAGEWAAAIERALASFPEHPFILQRFGKSTTIETTWFDFQAKDARPMNGRVRLCPYYFVTGGATRLGGVLATVCPANKKILHGMTDAIMVPCCLQSDETPV
ncbi:MAG: hypothetical protein FJ395_06495 [Verrucomicrobia bacterium]|nr:hypothetical protein [Verrucomicrobiota bacterium]